MQTRVPDYYAQFRCLAGSCPDTCCGQWEIVIDAKTAARYRELEGPLGDRIRQHLVCEDGEYSLSLEQSRCPMLNNDGLCDIISQLGEDALSVTCDAHPRFTEIYGNLAETALSLSCPAAAELLLNRQTPLTFRTGQDDTPIEPNDLDPDQFSLLLHSRETAYAMVQDRSRPLSDRLALLLCFAHRLQSVMDTQRWQLGQSISCLYRDPLYQDRQLCRVRRLRRYGTMTDARQLLRSMEHLTEDFPKVLPELEKTDPDAHSLPLEQLTVYLLFRWWLKAACDDRLWRQAAAVVVSVLTVSGLTKILGSCTDAARLFSKEIEHAESNLALLRAAMELPMFDLAHLLAILEVPHAV